MSRWFRHYAGLCRDEKLVSVAIKAKQPIERVVWVWAAILESAAEIDDNGRYQLDAAEVAYFLRADEADISAVEAALATSGRVADGAVVKWSNRQFRSDRSAERVAAHRERKRSGEDQRQHNETSQNGDVTLEERHGNSPETELETDTETQEDTASAASSAPRAPAVDLEDAERRCHEAAGSDRLGSFAPISELLHRQADLELDILPVIRARPAAGGRVSSWKFYVPIIVEAMAKRVPAQTSQGPPKVFVLKGSPEWLRRVASGHKPGLCKFYPEHQAEGWLFTTEAGRSAA